MFGVLRFNEFCPPASETKITLELERFALGWKAAGSCRAQSECRLREQAGARSSPQHVGQSSSVPSVLLGWLFSLKSISIPRVISELNLLQ